MKKFVEKIFIFFTICFIFLSISDFVVTKGLQKTESSFFKEWNDIYSGNINADVIINGSSRAWFHISPEILDTILNVNSYNLGLEGQDVHTQYLRYSVYTKYNNKPKLVIQTVDFFMFDKKDTLPNYQQYLPYLYKDMVRQFTYNYSNVFSVSDYIIPYYRYLRNRDISRLGFNQLFFYEKIFNGNYKGYKLKENREWDSSFYEMKKANPNGINAKYDIESLEVMNKLLSESRNDKTNVVLVYTPEYIEVQKITNDRDKVIKIFNDFANKYNILFLDYSKDTMSYNRKYFYNSEHLNLLGAELFSVKLAEDIKKNNLLEIK